MRGEPGVRLTGVRKRYRGAGEVLAGVDLELSTARPVVVLGRNGAGKSTLLRVVAGVSRPSAGAVSGRPPVVGFLPGRLPTGTRLPVRRYLTHLAGIRGDPDGVRGTLAVLDELGFHGELNGPLAALSSGNLQKALLAHAMGTAVGLLVLDEPWSALDSTASGALDRRITAAVGDGTVVLLADHTGRAAALPGARMLRLTSGTLVAARAPVPHTVIELDRADPGRDPDAADLLRALPSVAEAWPGPGTLTVRVRTDRGDAVLAAALARGCSVRAVRREEGP